MACVFWKILRSRFVEVWLVQDRPVPELVAATGTGLLGGFTLFQVRLYHDNDVTGWYSIVHSSATYLFAPNASCML